MPRSLRRAVVAFGLLAAPVVAQQPMSPEQQAEVLLTGGQKALAAGDLPAASNQFQQVVQKFGNTPQATAAKYGIGLILLASPEQNFAAAAEALTPAANDGGFRDRGQALYALGVCQRALGLKELDKGDAGKAEADKRFAEAANRFNDAQDWLWGQDRDKAGRARCDLAEVQLRLGKVKDARNTCDPFVSNPEFAKNASRPLGLYYLGLAAFLDRDHQAAGRALNQLAPFADPGFGLHARYLVGRVLHLSGENAEASVNYDAVLADYEKAKTAAVEALKQPDRFKGNPSEKARLEALAKAAPEYVAAAAFHGAGLNYEAGKFADALAKFQGFAQAYQNSPLQPDATLRAGLCLVQLRQFDEAAKLLAPLADKTPRLADQALLWLGKAQLGLAAASEEKDREPKLKAAVESLRKAVEKAQQLAGQNDPDAKARLPEARFEYADGLQAAKQFKDAAQVYQQLWGENGLPARREEVLQRLASATGAAGDFDRSNQCCDEFRRTFTQSVLTPVVMFRSAENAYARAAAILKEKKAVTDEVKQRLSDAGGKYREVADKFPEFERVNYARLGAGVCLSQLGDLDGAVKALEAIPAPDRSGENAAAAYLLADCLIRQAPDKADDALAENIIREKLTAAAQLLEGFAGGSPQSPDAPAALLKLGFCLKRLGSTLADANERNQTLNRAREVYEKLSKDYPQSPLTGNAVLERAKVRALMGDRGGAMNDLRAFASDGNLQKSSVAPLAAMSLATLYREENNPNEAVKVMADARQKFDGPLAGDPERAEWVPLLKYHHAVGVLESGKPADARPLFEEVIKQAAGKPVAAEAALRAGQCRLAVSRKEVEAAQQERNQAGNDQNKQNAANEKVRKAREGAWQAADELLRRGDEFKQSQPTADARARLYYDAAWAWRWLAEDEINRAWDDLRKQANGQPVPRGKVPVQAGEERAFHSYRRLIEEFADNAVAVDARFELAELLAERGQTDDAVKLLKDALDKEPTDRPVPPDTLERVRLRLGAALAAKGEFAAAAGQFDAVAANAKSPYLAQALYRAGDCLASAGEFDKAAERLKPFRDKPELHNVGGVSDRATVRLGQALLGAKKWDEARQAFETALQRFGNGNPFAVEARYGIGAAQQGAGKLDEAVAAFQAVTAATTAEVAARAQLQIGQCRLAQKKFPDAAAAFLLVPYTYDAGDLGFAAMLEAARAFAEGNQPADAERVLRKLAKDAPKDGEWAKAAAERLAKLKQ